MTIDEAYNTCFGKPYIVPIDKHEEAKSIIRDLIEEVKQYREIGTLEECRNSVLDIPKAYNKAIDDLLGERNQITYNCQDADELFEKICDLAEQLKAGEMNEMQE